MDVVFLKINKQTSSHCHVVHVTRVQQPCISFSIIMKGTKTHTTELTWVGKKRNICTLGNWWCERWSVRFWVSHSCSAKAPILATRVTTFLRLEIYADWYYFHDRPSIDRSMLHHVKTIRIIWREGLYMPFGEGKSSSPNYILNILAIS